MNESITMNKSQMLNTESLIQLILQNLSVNAEQTTHLLQFN